MIDIIALLSFAEVGSVVSSWFIVAPILKAEVSAASGSSGA